MKVKSISRSTLALLLVICNISCDQLSKNIVREHVAYYDQIPVIPNYVTLTKVENAGAFLSLGSALPDILRMALLTLLPLLVLAYGLYLLFVRRSTPGVFMIGLSFVLGGGIGNLIDRLLYGSVTDFLHIDFIVFQTGIFNMADVSILIGIALLFYHIYLAKGSKS
ncbi:signal peptidase II [Olivibacter sp. SDN3]|uniref:signal peptidase II n=1 Tax=Olivibacter sp. SDN3 TaxID=2764720 RepID=UPI00165124E0|nr:signal peptidase II [Olivibacter sp. SDN3]QNL48367.1 signal peptidase II [Olivibacter sp. SDN3]